MEIVGEVLVGIAVLTLSVLFPGHLLERRLVRSGSLALRLLLVPVLGCVSVATLSVSLSFLLGTYVTTRLLLLSAAAIVLLLLGSTHGQRPARRTLSREELLHGASLAVALCVVVGFHWSIYEASYPTIYSRCSFQVTRYLLGLPEHCRVRTGLNAELPPPRALPEDMVMECPGDPACPYRLVPFSNPLEMEREDGAFIRHLYTREAQFGYPLLTLPFARALRFLGLHLFFLLTRALCFLSLFVLLRRSSGSHWCALLVAAVAMVNPVIATLSTHNENLAGLFLGACVVTLLLERGGTRGGRHLAAGLVLGSLLGVRHFMVLSAPATIAYVLLNGPPAGRRRGLALLVTGALAALFPYMYMHQLQFGSILANESVLGTASMVNALPLTGGNFTSSFPLNYPFHQDIVRAPSLPFPTGILHTIIIVHMFGVLLSAAGIVGLCQMYVTSRPAALLLTLWFLPPFLFMGMVTDWNVDKCSYLFLVVLAPAAWVCYGIAVLARDGHRRRGLALMTLSSLLVLLLLRTLSGMTFPPDWRIPSVYFPRDSMIDTGAPSPRAWTDASLLPGWPAPLAGLLQRSGVREQQLFRWSDVASFNLDRKCQHPCEHYVGTGLGRAGEGLGPLWEGRGPGTSTYTLVLNPDHIWSIPYGQGILAANRWCALQVGGDLASLSPPYSETNDPPNLVVLEELGDATLAEVDQSLALALGDTPGTTPILFMLSDLSASGALAGGVLGSLSPILMPTGEVETAIGVRGDVLSRPDGIAGRARPLLTEDAEVLWRYADGVALLAMRRDRGTGRGVWFLNALVEKGDEAGAVVLSEAVERVKGSPVQVTVSFRDGALELALSAMPNSAVPDHPLPPVTVAASPPATPAQADLVVPVPPGTDRLTVLVDGVPVYEAGDLPSAGTGPVLLTVRSGGIQAGLIALVGDVQVGVP